jgi:hypothetical protein
LMRGIDISLSPKMLIMITIREIIMTMMTLMTFIQPTANRLPLIQPLLHIKQLIYSSLKPLTLF